MNPAWLVPVMAYLLGSIPFGYLIVKLREGRDIRATGSGNIGAANVTRVMGRGAGAVTLLLDMGKGYAAVWLAGRMTGESATWMAVAALVAVVGHVFTVWLKFKGGKGFATGVGAFLLICWPAVGCAMLVWVAVVAVWRYVSLGSVTASAALPILTYAFYAPGYAPPAVVSAATTLAAVLIIWKHRANLQRIAAGTEPKLNLRKTKN
jgi:glycerol-3-phosphate acyltransferase PlsY